MNLAAVSLPPFARREATCVRCGCSDMLACPDGCAWAVLDPDRGLGICTSCTHGQQTVTLELALRRAKERR